MIPKDTQIENNIMSTHANPNRNLASKSKTTKQQTNPSKNLEERIHALEGRTQNFYNYQLWSPQLLNRIILLAVITAVGFCVWASFSFLKKPDAVEPIYTKIEGIKRLGELHLVEHYYESIIPITNLKEDNKGNPKNEKLEFLLKAPVKVSGYLDFSRIQMKVLEDSLVHIELPPAQISEAYLDLKKTEEYMVDGKLRIFKTYFQNIDHEKVYKDIARGINNNKIEIRKRAKVNDIEKETHLKAKIFLRNFVSTLGYRVEFPFQPMEINPADTTKSNTKLYNFATVLKQIDSIVIANNLKPQIQ